MNRLPVLFAQRLCDIASAANHSAIAFRPGTVIFTRSTLGPPAPRRKFVKGESGNRRGRPPGKGPGPIVMCDLKQAMRALCPEAAEVVKRCLKSDNEKIALLAAQIAFDRGFGRPDVHGDVDVNHKFVIAPESNMRIDEWLATKGQGWAAHRRER
jgi:hypothetical protein